MSEYKLHLDEYHSEFYRVAPTKEEWGNREKAEEYLSKYWLSKSEYENFWSGIKHRIFDPNFIAIPEKMFLSDFEIIPLMGGALFPKDEFEMLKLCFKETKDSQFVIIENTYGKDNPLAFRMKYPSDISYEELNDGNYISTVLFDMPIKEYFVFGKSGVWGMYAATDSLPTLSIVGVKHKFVSSFVEKYKIVRKNYERLPNAVTNKEIIASLPASYKAGYIIH